MGTHRVVYTSPFNTAIKSNFTVPDVKSWQPGEYILEATGLDKNGAEVKSVSYFTVYSPKAARIPVAAVNYFQPIKLIAEPGENASFSAGTAERDVLVLYEIEQNGTILFKQWVKINNEQRFFEIPIREEYRGDIGIHWTFIKNNRLYHGDHSVAVPYSNKDLDISFQTFRNKLHPGESEEWKILVKGKAAEKIAAEMVATLYDESLDTFRPNFWYAQLFFSQSSVLRWESANGFNSRELTPYVIIGTHFLPLP